MVEGRRISLVAGAIEGGAGDEYGRVGWADH